MRPAAYKGASLWRAAVHEPGRGPDDEQETLLMTDHIFENCEMAMRFANIYIRATKQQKNLLKAMSASDHALPVPDSSVFVNLLELYENHDN